MMRSQILMLVVTLLAGACGTDNTSRSDLDRRSELSPTPVALSSERSASAQSPIPAASSVIVPSSPSPEPAPTSNPSIEPSPASSSNPTPSPRQEVGLRPTIESIQSNLIDKKCLSCHRSASESNGLVDLRDLRENISAFPGRNPQINGARATVMSGCPDYSILSLALRKGTMPPAPAPHLSDAEITVVDDWIRSLDPNRAGCAKK